MNWGKGIAIALTLFVGFILFLAISLMRTNFDLVSEDYYNREINYEEEIQAKRNANSLAEKIQFSANETHVLVVLPAEIDYKNVTLSFSRPNDKNLDRNYTIEGTRTFTIDKDELVIGNYTISINYTVNDKNCLQIEEIYI